MGALLEVKDLRVNYGGIQAVRGINLQVNQGELVCLIGANGAGKTTTLKAITGMLRANPGSVMYAGQDISGMPSYEIARSQLVMVPEGRGIFGQLTIEENLRMGAYNRNDKPEIDNDIAHVYSLFPRLKERADLKQSAGTLSGGEQQMLAIGRALLAKPKLLLLDEPSMGLAPIMVEKIFEVVQTISKQGVTILLIEQNAFLALKVSQRGYVLDGGQISLTDNCAALLDNPQVREAYLGA
jgi:branched-chain amino acid transport system ATP-binding protein